jgi:hypothetical protein
MVEAVNNVLRVPCQNSSPPAPTHLTMPDGIRAALGVREPHITLVPPRPAHASSATPDPAARTSSDSFAWPTLSSVYAVPPGSKLLTSNTSQHAETSHR